MIPSFFQGSWRWCPTSGTELHLVSHNIFDWWLKLHWNLLMWILGREVLILLQSHWSPDGRRTCRSGSHLGRHRPSYSWPAWWYHRFSSRFSVSGQASHCSEIPAVPNILKSLRFSCLQDISRAGHQTSMQGTRTVLIKEIFRLWDEKNKSGHPMNLEPNFWAVLLEHRVLLEHWTHLC